MQLEENSIIIEKNKDRYALQPTLRFNKFNNTWKKLPFKELVKINQGLQIPISDRLLEKEKDALFYITNEFLKKNSKVTYYIKNASQSVTCLESDILMTRTGNTGMVVTNVSGAFHNNFFKIKYPDYIDKDFLVYFLRLPKTQNKILRLAGTSTIPDLNHSDFYKIYFKFPSFEEQQKIASFLSAVDKRIHLLEQKKAKLNEYKKGVMQQIFNREIRFKDKDAKEFPDWKPKKLGEILEIGSGKDYKHLKHGNIPVYGTGGLMRYVDDFLFEGETVCIGRKGTIDKPYYLNGKLWTVDTLFYTHSYIKSNPKFIYYLFQTVNWLKYNEASGVPSLSKQTIKTIPVEIPCIEEQNKIAAFLTSIDNKIELIEKQIEGSNQFKKGLLQQMFV